MKKIATMLVLLLFCPNMLLAMGIPNSQWGYNGNIGPEHWGGLDSSYILCQIGKKQSPINIIDPAMKGNKPITFHYHTETLLLFNNSITLEALIQRPDQNLIYEGKRYDLKNIHIHSPSEHFLNGFQYDLELHLVHQNAFKHLLVLAVFVKTGNNNPFLAIDFKRFSKNMKKPELDKTNLGNPIDVLPKNRNHVRYEGSLTTPPCTEGVTWLVFENPITASKEQISQFRTRLYRNNARPIQRLNNRILVLNRNPV